MTTFVGWHMSLVGQHEEGSPLEFSYVGRPLNPVNQAMNIVSRPVKFYQSNMKCSPLDSPVLVDHWVLSVNMNKLLVDQWSSVSRHMKCSPLDFLC